MERLAGLPSKFLTSLTFISLGKGKTVAVAIGGGDGEKGGAGGREGGGGVGLCEGGL